MARSTAQLPMHFNQFILVEKPSSLIEKDKDVCKHCDTGYTTTCQDPNCYYGDRNIKLKKPKK